MEPLNIYSYADVMLEKHINNPMIQRPVFNEELFVEMSSPIQPRNSYSFIFHPYDNNTLEIVYNSLSGLISIFYDWAMNQGQITFYRKTVDEEQCYSIADISNIWIGMDEAFQWNEDFDNTMRNIMFFVFDMFAINNIDEVSILS